MEEKELTLLEILIDKSIIIAIIIFSAGLAHRFSMIAVRKIIRKSIKSEHFETRQDEKKREETLLSTANAGVRAIIWTLAFLMILAQLGINLAPLLAGAGIAGVALGFGAQSMVKDFLAGFFILAENHYRVGDVVELNQTVSGTVQEVTLRETVLRDLDGMVHHIPNGEITLATNMTMDFANVNLNIGIGYDTDLEKLEKVVNDVGKKLSEDPDWSEQILEAPKFLRVNDFGDSAIEIKIIGKTQPMKQWAVTGELRKQLKIAFDKNGIEIPFPQRVIHQQKTTK